MKLAMRVYGYVVIGCLLSTAALAQSVFPETIRGCWSGDIGAQPAFLQWEPKTDAATGWKGVATVSPAEREPFVEHHTLAPPRPGIVNLGWRYCHPEREGRKSAERCFWTRGPSGDLENYVSFETVDDRLHIDSYAFGEKETLFRGARAPCPRAN